MFKYLKLENGVKYCSKAFKDHCNRFGIKHENIVIWHSSTKWYCKKDELHYHGDDDEHILKFRVGKAFLGINSEENMLPH